MDRTQLQRPAARIRPGRRHRAGLGFSHCIHVAPVNLGTGARTCHVPSLPQIRRLALQPIIGRSPRPLWTSIARSVEAYLRQPEQ